MTKEEILSKCIENNFSTDYLYYVVQDKKSHAKSIICSAWNLLFSNEHQQIAGVTIYTTKNNVPKHQHKDYSPSKIINGEEYIKVCAKIIDGVYHNLTFKENKEQIFLNKIDVEPKFSSILTDNFTFYNYEDVIDIIDPISSARHAYETSSRVKKVLNMIMEDYSIPLENIGVIGSVALGSNETHDFDLILYGNSNEIARYKKILDKQITKNGKFKVGDIYVPFLYDRNGESLDILFSYKFDKPISYKRPRLIKDNIYFEVEICSEDWSYNQFPIYIAKSSKLKLLTLRLGLMSSLFRMSIKKGDVVKGVGSLVKYIHNGQIKHMILCVYPEEQIENYQQYFTKQL